MIANVHLQVATHAGFSFRFFSSPLSSPFRLLGSNSFDILSFQIRSCAGLFCRCRYRCVLFFCSFFLPRCVLVILVAYLALRIGIVLFYLKVVSLKSMCGTVSFYFVLFWLIFIFNFVHLSSEAFAFVLALVQSCCSSSFCLLRCISFRVLCVTVVILPWFILSEHR